ICGGALGAAAGGSVPQWGAIDRQRAGHGHQGCVIGRIFTSHKSMLLTLDVGNSQIFCGVYDGEQLRTTFRRTSGIRASSDEFAAFFRAMLRENGVDPEAIDMAGICSTAPDAVHSLRNCFRKYFRFEPFLL